MPGDCDGDGEAAAECGGNDCDDDDARRFPSATEVCDADDVDEDCDPSTFGGRDGDMDGAVDAACCNVQPGGDLLCGSDCDDDDINVNPSATEICDAADNDCSGAADDASDLCPGGACLSGACRLDGWERVFGGSSHDYVTDLTIDGTGRVTAVARVAGPVDFGQPPPGESYAYSSVVTVQFGPARAYRWDATLSPCAGLPSPHRPVGGVAHDASDNIYVVAGCTGGGGVAQTVIASYTSDGVERWTTAPLDVAGESISVSTSGAVFVGGYAEGTVDLGGGAHAATREDGFVLELDAAGAYVGESWVAGDTDARVTSVAARPAGGVVLGLEVERASSGMACVDIDGTAVCDADAFGAVVALTSAGAVEWHHVVGEEVGAVGAAADGAVAILALFTGTLSVGGPNINSSPSRADGVVVAYDSAGVYRWKRHLQSPGVVNLGDLAVGPDGSVAVSGAFSETITLAGTPSGAGRTDRDIFAAWYESDGSHTTDVVAGASGNDDGLAIAVGGFRDTAFAGVFLGTVVLGRGSYTATGTLGDAFIVRTNY